MYLRFQSFASNTCNDGLVGNVKSVLVLDMSFRQWYDSEWNNRIKSLLKRRFCFNRLVRESDDTLVITYSLANHTPNEILKALDDIIMDQYKCMFSLM